MKQPRAIEKESGQIGRRYSVRRQLTTVVSGSFSVAVVLAFTAMLLFISAAEQEIGLARQGEATNSATHTLNTFFAGVQHYLSIVSQIKGSYLITYRDTLGTLLKQNNALIEMIRLDHQDRVIASAQTTESVLNNPFTISQSSWLASVRAGEPYLSDIQVSSTGQPYLILAAPAVDDGVLAARLQADVLWEVIEDLRFGETGLAYIVDGRGNIVAHPDPEVVVARTTIMDRPEMQAVRNTPGSQWSGFYENFQGRNVRGYAVQLGNVDFWVFTEISRRETGAIARRATFTLGAGLVIIGMVVSGFVQSMLRQRIFEPLERLHDGVERVGQGDLDYRVESMRPDEIGQVAATFNLMTTQLQEREQALERARDEAQAASEFKSRLLANVSHDLRTPLNGILGYTDMLQEGVFGPLTPEQATANNRILSNTQRLLSMINNLLDQARIDAGKIEITYTRFSPVDLLEEIENILGLLAVRKGLALNVGVELDFPAEILGDRQRIQQIIMNLVTNAIKFTDHGTVTVHIQHYDDDHWCIRVTDTGRGIPPEAQTYIFEPFRQVDSSTTRDQGGMGLGLSIVKQLVTLMNGAILLDSIPDQGSIFTVVLPYVLPDTPTEAQTL